MINSFNKIVQEDLTFITSVDLPWHEFEGKSILVTGANGSLPAYLIETILYLNRIKFKKKAKIYALARNREKTDKRFASYLDDDNLKFIIQDVCEEVSIPGALDFIIHAASQASPNYYAKDPTGTLLPNVLGTYRLLELARAKNVSCFLYFSSGAIYGSRENNNLTAENDFGPLNPLSIEACYPESKRMGENMCIAWMHQYGVPIKIVRPFHTYGPGFELTDGRVFADFVKNIVFNEDIVLNSDGSAKRSFCYLADATVGFFTVILKGNAGEAYNVSASDEISVKELAEKLISFFPEKKLKVVYKKNEKQGYLKTKILKYSPDNSKLKKLGWYENYSIEAGFKRTIASLADNNINHI
jgi:nucleoside-diphosphate-sugar epimerase